MPTLVSVTLSCCQIGFCSSGPSSVELEMIVIVVGILVVLVHDILAEEVVGEVVSRLSSPRHRSSTHTPFTARFAAARRAVTKARRDGKASPLKEMANARRSTAGRQIPHQVKRSQADWQTRAAPIWAQLTWRERRSLS